MKMNQPLNSANDASFQAVRAHALKSKTSSQSVPGLPEKIKIFKYAGNRFWQIRFFAFGQYIIRSLKTPHLEAAQKTAQMYYQQNFGSAGLPIETTSPKQATFIDAGLLHDLIEQLLAIELAKVKRDEIKHNSYLITKTRLQGAIYEFFSRLELAKLSAGDLEDFLHDLTLKNMSGPTIQGYLAVLKKLLKLMHKREIIPLIPLFPALKVQYKPRGAFTVSEYISIVRKARELRGVKFDDWGKGKRIWIKENYQVMSDEMHLLIRFMIYTFMRPGDVRQIKHKHVEIIRGKFTYLRLTLPEVKRHNAQVVSLPPAVAIYESQLKRQRHAGLGCPDDHVFFPQETDRKLALGIAGWQFNWILKELDIKNGPHGTERSLYSLRHTAIMFRLLYGGNIDLLTLAKNARTSVEMIEKFYASTLAAETNVSLLHSRRSRL